MSQYRIEVLQKGDSVLNVWSQYIAIKRKNGDVEILHYDFDSEGALRINKDSILITKGNGSIHVKSEDSSFEAGTF